MINVCYVCLNCFINCIKTFKNATYASLIYGNTQIRCSCLRKPNIERKHYHIRRTKSIVVKITSYHKYKTYVVKFDNELNYDFTKYEKK